MILRKEDPMIFRQNDLFILMMKTRTGSFCSLAPTAELTPQISIQWMRFGKTI